MRILLIRLRQIGDVVFTTPAVHALRAQYPSSHIAYIVEPNAAAIVEGNPDIDEVIVAPRGGGMGGFAADMRLGRRLRAERFDLAIDFHGGPRASLLTWLSGARERVGYNVPGRGWMYTRRVPRTRSAHGRHSVINQWALIDALRADIPRPAPDTFPVMMHGSRDAQASVARRLADAGVSPADRIVVMHVSAGNPFRRWPAASFADVAARIVAEHHDRRLLVTSGPSEHDAAAHVIATARERLTDEGARARIVACGEFSLAELRALVDRASLYIGGDSGPMHVASTSSVPIVALYGPTMPERSAPWRDPAARSAAVEVHGLPCRPCDQRRCEPGDFRCLCRIDPAQVVDASERLLGDAAVQ